MGHGEAVIADDKTWAISYFVINTRNWIPGKKVLISPQRIFSFDWEEGMISANMDRDNIRHSQPLEAMAASTPDYADKMHHH
jgi:hypothetical protein